jgi:hypothetical protein
MEPRRLVVWISTAILGFQGATLAFDLLNCTALSWLYVRLNGFGPQQVVQQPGAMPEEDARPSGDVPAEGAARASSGSDRASAPTSLERFCARPQDRIDDAVNQGLSVLAGLALGSSATGRGQGEP